MIREEFINKLEILLSKLDFNEDVITEAREYIRSNYSYISKKSREAYESDWEKYFKAMNNPYLSLMILIYKIVELEETYIKRVLPEEVMLDTLSDLVLRQRLYFLDNNRLGLTEEDISWLRHIYYLNIFKLGTLQYELGEMTYKECDKEEDFAFIREKLPIGSSVLRVHIMRGVDFSRNSVDESFKYSKLFFKTHFSEFNFKAYTCYSWMLYSRNHLFLSETSNILDFSKRFTLICETKGQDMSMKYIFRRKYDSLNDYPKETSLQRNVLNNLENLGVGFGIILI